MKAFYGQDLHWRRQHRGLFNLIDSESSTRGSILEAFRMGKYQGCIEETHLPSDGKLSESLFADYDVVNRQYMRKRKVFENLKRMSGSAGKHLPAPLKNRIRKLFT